MHTTHKKKAKSPRLIFVTGTDTGVGKTLLTALFLTHKRAKGEPAYALKPFCSGGRSDAELLHALQGGDLELDEINPFSYAAPLAPWIAARRARRAAPVLAEVVARIRAVCAGIEPSACLFIEGAGGLLVPLGDDFTTLDLIVALQCEIVIVARNALGTINHTLLSVLALNSAWQDSPVRFRGAGAGLKNKTHSSPAVRVVLMGTRNQDASTASNHSAIAHFLGPVPLFSVPFLGRFASSVSAVRKNEKKIKKTLARILD